MDTFTSDPTEPDEPAGSEADRLEQVEEQAGDDGIHFELPDDPEVPLEDAWEGAIPVGGDDDDEHPRDT
jgi:hypothetical protein